MATRAHRRGGALLRRGGGLLVALVVAAAGVLALILYFSGHDAATTGGHPAVPVAAGPGRGFADLGDRHLRPGERPDRPYSSHPPTSGPHVVRPVERDATALSDDQVLTALERGDVVLAYGAPRPPAALAALARSEAGAPFTPALARTGQAVILGRRADVRAGDVVALAWGRQLRAASPRDPRLEAFIQAWLGQGAPGRSP